MGIASFFSWLIRKYPSIVSRCIEDQSSKDEDLLKPNPNGVEFDNLYLDMNDIIHQCTRVEVGQLPKNEDEMIIKIFEFIDRIFSIVRPRKLLYLAIDGVCPHAKMNQQRSRRFQAAAQGELIENNLSTTMIKEQKFDSICITPGTVFMFRLAECLRFYILSRMNNVPAWRNLIVILSDASVPDEGEHKIMEYIRCQRAQPNYNIKTNHVLYGMDADLILLGLAIHEPYFTIMRQEFVPNRDRFGIQGDYSLSNEQFDVNIRPFIYVNLLVLRDHIYCDLKLDLPPSFTWNIERAVDDWIFLCCLVGNDYLPHLPSLQIGENAIDRLTDLYKENLSKFREYLTENGIPNMERTEIILNGIGRFEDEIFRNRNEQNTQANQEEKQKKVDQAKKDAIA
ncbi:unnamed protein product, partial [Didymodactylos carnosus]